VARRVVAVVGAVVGALAIVVASVGWWVDRTMLDPEALVARAEDLLDQPAVRDAVADELRREVPLAAAVEQLVPGSVSATVSDPAFRPIFRSAVRDAHDFLLDPSVPSVSVDLQGYSEVLADIVGRRDPAYRDAVASTAQELGGMLSADTLTFRRSELPAAWDVLVSTRDLVLPLAAIGLLLVLGAVVLHPRHVAALGWAGAVLLLGGAVTALGATALRDRGGSFPGVPVRLSEAGSLVVDRFVSDLVPQSVGLALIGLVCLVAAVGARLLARREPIQ